MGFPQMRERLQAGVFARLGEDGLWNGQTDPVRVRLGEEDQTLPFGEAGQLIGRSQVIRVRKSEIAAPIVNDEATLVASGRRFRVFADPMLDANGVWTCPVVEQITGLE